MFFFRIIPFFLMLLFIGGGTKDNDNDDDIEDVVGSPVALRGELDASASEVAKVIAYSSTGRNKVGDIISGSFSLQLDNGKPWGLNL